MSFCAYCGQQVTVVSFAPCPKCGSPTNGAPRPVAGRSSNPAVIIMVLVIGGLVLVAIVGILAAIAIPNLLTAQQRSKQVRTMADMRTIAAAAEAFATDNKAYPKPDAWETALAPRYIETLPRTDGWSHPLRYECWSTTDAEACDAYAIGSGGKDGAFERQGLKKYIGGGATTNFNSVLAIAGERRATHEQRVPQVHGRWAEAFRFNAFGVVFAPLLLAGAVSETRYVLRGPSSTPRLAEKPWIAWAAFALIVSWGIGRNLVGV